MKKNRDIAKEPSAEVMPFDGETRIIHELHAQRIELEIQNQEMEMQIQQMETKRGQLDAVLRSYLNVYEFLPLACFVLAADGAICQTNLRGEALLGVDRSKLLQTRFGAFVVDEDLGGFSVFLRNTFEGNVRMPCTVGLRDNVPGDVLWASDGGGERAQHGLASVQLEASLLPDKKQCCMVVISSSYLSSK